MGNQGQDLLSHFYPGSVYARPTYQVSFYRTIGVLVSYSKLGRTDT